MSLACSAPPQLIATNRHRLIEPGAVVRTLLPAFGSVQQPSRESNWFHAKVVAAARSLDARVRAAVVSSFIAMRLGRLGAAG